MIGIDRYIPGFLLPYKNEWVVASWFSIALFRSDTQVLRSEQLFHRIDFPSCTKAHGKVIRRYYNVKEVLAKAKAHGYSAIEASPYYARMELDQTDRDLLAAKRRLKDIEDRIAQANIRIGQCTSRLEAGQTAENVVQQVHRLFVEMAYTRNLPPFEGPGVYVMTNHEEVLYVGQASNIASRVKERVKVCPAIVCIGVDDQDDRSRLERMLIQLLGPSGNTQYNTRRIPRASRFSGAMDEESS